jgi:hypothetical protein
MARLAQAPTVPESLGTEWQQLLRWMTATRPEDRPTALDVMVAASRLLPGPASADVDQPTAAAPRPGSAALNATPTGVTAILPLEPLETAAFPPGSSSRVSPDRARRRRTRIIATLAAGILVIGSLVGGALWLSSPFGTPGPAPSQPAEEVVPDPDVEQAPVVENPAPADDPADTGNSGAGSGSGNGNGNGNGNSGPGNNNGNGKGNSGKDK